MIYRHPDVVVTGVGRTGTSFTAYLLQEKLDVCMAHNFDKPDKMINGGFPYAVGGYEEKYQMMTLTARLVTDDEWQKIPWLDRYTVLHEFCKGLVGIKQWRLSAAKREHWEMIKPGLVVRTFRPERPVVESMMRWRRPKNRAYWTRFYWERENNLSNVVDAPDFPFPVVRIDYSDRVSEEHVLDRLTPYIEEMNAASANIQEPQHRS